MIFVPIPNLTGNIRQARKETNPRCKVFNRCYKGGLGKDPR